MIMPESLSIGYDHIRDLSFAFMVEFLIVARVADYTVLAVPYGRGTSSVEIACIRHA
jgi:hypothetical protein